jgi:1-acyl-sn-glycerol-3-phosphate acyltransferase
MATLRSLLFIVWMYGLMGLMGFVWLPSLFMPKGAILFGIRCYTRLVRWGLRVICRIRTEIRGAQNMPEGPVIYAAKHQCMWDVFIPFLLMSAPAIIMKRELLWYPVLGWYALKAAMIPIDRAGTTKTLRKMVAEAKTRTGAGRQVVIFPEGTRSAPDADTTYYAAGISALYKALQVPVVPVATNAGLFWPAHGLIRRPGTAVYHILPPIAPGLDRKALMAAVTSAIEPASAALLSEARAGKTLPDGAPPHPSDMESPA